MLETNPIQIVNFGFLCPLISFNSVLYSSKYDEFINNRLLYYFCFWRVFFILRFYGGLSTLNAQRRARQCRNTTQEVINLL